MVLPNHRGQEGGLAEVEKEMEESWDKYVAEKSDPGSGDLSVQGRVKPWQFSVLRSIGTFILLAGFQDRLGKCGNEQARAEALKGEIQLFSADNGIVNKGICFTMLGVDQIKIPTIPQAYVFMQDFPLPAGIWALLTEVALLNMYASACVIGEENPNVRNLFERGLPRLLKSVQAATDEGTR